MMTKLFSQKTVYKVPQTYDLKIKIQMVTFQTASNKLGIAQSTLARWRDEGYLSFTRVDGDARGTCLLPESEVHRLRFIKEMCDGNTRTMSAGLRILHRGEPGMRDEIQSKMAEEA